MRHKLFVFGFCAVAAAACDMSPNPRFAAAGPTPPTLGGGGGQNALVVQPAQVEIFVGATFQLTTNAHGAALFWNTSNSSIARVSSSGLVSGVNAGIAIITATSAADPSQTASSTVIVSTR